MQSIATIIASIIAAAATIFAARLRLTAKDAEVEEASDNKSTSTVVFNRTYIRNNFLIPVYFFGVFAILCFVVSTYWLCVEFSYIPIVIIVVGFASLVNVHQHLAWVTKEISN